MSLINEALRKARREAAANGDDQQVMGPPAGLRRGPRIPFEIVALLAVVVLAGAAGGAATWWILRDDSRPARAASPDSPSPEVPAVVAEPEPAAAAVAGPVATPTPSPLPVEAATAADAAPLTPTEAADTPAPTPTRTPAPSGPLAIGPAGERIYLVEADLDGTHLSLGYLVFRPVDPFAEINGREVRVGAEVEGYRVTAIEREAVTLRRGEAVIVLQAK